MWAPNTRLSSGQERSARFSRSIGWTLLRDPLMERQRDLRRVERLLESRAFLAVGQLAALVLGCRDERLEDIHRQREHDRRALVAADLDQRLQVAQLDRDRVAADDVGGVRQPCRGLEL